MLPGFSIKGNVAYYTFTPFTVIKMWNKNIFMEVANKPKKKIVNSGEICIEFLANEVIEKRGYVTIIVMLGI